MAKKYLTLDEAAHQLGMAPDELVRLRERGEIRGFADRGTWKFKSEDIEEFARIRQPDSSPEVPILDDKQTQQSQTPPGELDRTSLLSGDSGVRKGQGSGRLNKTSDSDVRLLLDETLVPGGKDSDPEVALTQLGSSDSDVRLMDDGEGLVDSGSDSDVKLISTGSDSDVVLAPSAESEADSGSDSDVKLVGSKSDSDVRLASKPARGPKPGGSDSDVRLVGMDELASLGSDSDIRLTTSEGSSIDLAGSGAQASSSASESSSSDSTMAMNLGDSSGSDESSVLLGDESGIALGAGSSVKTGAGSSSDSGITLQSLGDSGISLEQSDSGISLEKVDSGISLAGPMDSGIALDRIPDSGIALSADSGIRLADDGSSVDKEGNRTVPMLKMTDDSDDDSTKIEVPSFGEDSSYPLSDKGRPETSVVLFAEDDEEEPAKPAKKGKKGRIDDSFALQESGVEFAEAEDFSDDDDLEVAEDVLAEEGDIDEIDVFEPAEEDFDSSVQSGESHAEFAAAIPALRAAAPVEVEWGGLTFAGLALSGVFLALSGVVMYDLVRTMWFWDQNVMVSGVLIDALRGMF